VAAHETFDRKHEVKGSSDRTFGLVFAAFFLIVTLTPLRKHLPPRWWALALAAAFALVAVVAPGVLKPLNKAWMRFGLLLSKVTSPVVMGVIFYGFVTPYALIARALGKDPLRLRFDAKAPSYWIERERRDFPPESMKEQF
jgi:predicted membrane metal-binding protein